MLTSFPLDFFPRGVLVLGLLKRWVSYGVNVNYVTTQQQGTKLRLCSFETLK